MKHSSAPWGHGNTPFAGLFRALAFQVAALLLLATTLIPPVTAQISTASLAVHAVDQDDDALPGVTVEVLNSDTGLLRTAITDESGSVSILALPPGPYEVTASLEGMHSPDPETATLRIGQRARLDLVLLPQIAEAMTVTSEAQLVDVNRLDSSTNIVPEQIESLPVADRQFEKLAFLAPGVQRDRTRFFDRTGAPVIGSASNAAVATILVDGVDFTDQFTGQSRQRLSQDSIREFRVVGQGFDAEIGGTSGGGLSIVTKSGTNRFRSSAFLYARDQALRAKGALELEEANYSRYHIGFTLGGPITRDRTHYFAAFEHLDEDQVALVRPGGAFSPLATDVVRPREQTTALFSLDHSFGPSSSGTTRFYGERYRRGNYDVGGVVDESHGWGWNRDVWTLVGGNTWVIGSSRLNELRVKLGQRNAEFPVNSTTLGEWFTFGNTLQTGGNWLESDGGLEGNFYGLRNTYHWQLGGGRHQLKTGVEYQHIDQYYKEDRFQNGLMVYLTDDRSEPYIYLHGDGSSAADLVTDLYGLFVQDDWRALDNLTLSLGLRYDVDTGSNFPDFKHPLVPEGRDVDYNNLQPRLGFSWDLSRSGKTVLRGGIGRFVGRYNQYMTQLAIMLNDVSGRTLYTRVSLPEFGLILDPADPKNTGFGLPPDIILLAGVFPVLESTQARLGISQQLGSSRLFFDAEAVYSEGRNEPVGRNTNWAGNNNPGWISPDYTDVGTITSEGHSRYKGLTLGLKGMLRGDHLITAGLLVADKKNILDDPLTLDGPSDPADIEAEWGRSGTWERYRLVTSGIFRLPWDLTLSAIYDYGSGQPWNRIYGYDFNGDLSSDDRPEGVARNDQDGPRISQFDLLLAKAFNLGDRGSLDLSVEIFNLFNTVNYDVRSVDNAMYYDGPTLGDPPGIPFVPNPGFGLYRDTHRPREIQLGLRYTY